MNSRIALSCSFSLFACMTLSFSAQADVWTAQAYEPLLNTLVQVTVPGSGTANISMTKPHADTAASGPGFGTASLEYRRRYTYTGSPSGRSFFQCFSAHIKGTTNGSSSDTHANTYCRFSQTMDMSSPLPILEGGAPGTYDISKSSPTSGWLFQCTAGQDSYDEFVKVFSDALVSSEYPSGTASSSVDGDCDLCPG